MHASRCFKLASILKISTITARLWCAFASIRGWLKSDYLISCPIFAWQRGLTTLYHTAASLCHWNCMQLRYHPNQMYSDFNAKDYIGPAVDLTEKQVQGIITAAQGFNQVQKSII